MNDNLGDRIARELAETGGMSLRELAAEQDESDALEERLEHEQEAQQLVNALEAERRALLAQEMRQHEERVTAEIRRYRREVDHVNNDTDLKIKAAYAAGGELVMGHSGPKVPRRTAEVTGLGLSEKMVAAYLPSNYRVTGTAPDGAVLIEGTDVAGWTFQNYVEPRLASGMLYARETTTSRENS